MKKMMILVAAFMVAVLAVAGTLLEPGLSGEFSGGAMIKGVALASTNATQTATVKAVYEWPVWGEVTEQKIRPYVVRTEVDQVETLTNWCDYVTANAVTNIAGGVTNVVYYDGITVDTNRVLRSVMKAETNTVRRAAITGRVAVTNSLYSLTASGGVATNGDVKIIGSGARLLIESAPVTVFWE